jgi:hypothetical protein
MPVSYAMTLQKSNLALADMGRGMRLLAYHPLLSYFGQQRYPSRQGLVSDASSSHQKLAPHRIQNSKSKFNQKDLEIIKPCKKICVPWINLMDIGTIPSKTILLLIDIYSK